MLPVLVYDKTMEQNKPFTTAVTFGRFNLPHRGHLDLFKQMAEAAGLVVVGLSEGPDNLPTRHRLRVLGTMLNAEGIPYSVRTALQPFDLFTKVQTDIKDDPSSAVAFFGEDQYKLATAVKRVMQWSSITVPRLTSSTMIRHLIDSEEWDLLAREVPPSIINEVIKLRSFELGHHNL